MSKKLDQMIKESEPSLASPVNHASNPEDYANTVVPGCFDARAFPYIFEEDYIDLDWEEWDTEQEELRRKAELIEEEYEEEEYYSDELGTCLIGAWDKNSEGLYTFDRTPGACFAMEYSGGSWNNLFVYNSKYAITGRSRCSPCITGAVDGDTKGGDNYACYCLDPEDWGDLKETDPDQYKDWMDHLHTVSMEEGRIKLTPCKNV